MEREGLSSTLDESADRIVMLEKEARERDCLVREHHSQTRSQALIRDQMKVTDGAGQEAGETSQSYFCVADSEHQKRE